MNEKNTILKYFSTCSDESMRDKHEKKVFVLDESFFYIAIGKEHKKCRFLFLYFQKYGFDWWQWNVAKILIGLSNLNYSRLWKLILILKTDDVTDTDTDAGKSVIPRQLFGYQDEPKVQLHAPDWQMQKMICQNDFREKNVEWN